MDPTQISENQSEKEEANQVQTNTIPTDTVKKAEPTQKQIQKEIITKLDKFYKVTSPLKQKVYRINGCRIKNPYSNASASHPLTHSTVGAEDINRENDKDNNLEKDIEGLATSILNNLDFNNADHEQDMEVDQLVSIHH